MFKFVYTADRKQQQQSRAIARTTARCHCICKFRLCMLNTANFHNPLSFDGPSPGSATPPKIRIYRYLIFPQIKFFGLHFAAVNMGIRLATHYPAPPIQFLTLALYKFIYLLTYLLTFHAIIFETRTL